MHYFSRCVPRIFFLLRPACFEHFHIPLGTTSRGGVQHFRWQRLLQQYLPVTLPLWSHLSSTLSLSCDHLPHTIHASSLCTFASSFLKESMS